MAWIDDLFSVPERITNQINQAVTGAIGIPNSTKGRISDFKSSFVKDLARPSRFDILLPIPFAMTPYISSSRSLQYRCEATQLPGRTFATTEQKTYGPIEKHPYLTTFNDIDLTIIVDDDMNQKIFFDAWLNYINPQYNNNFRYRDDYASTLTVNQYDVTNQLSYSINLYNAYPIAINQMDLNWNDDGYHRLLVTFSYTYWKNNSLQAIGMELIDQGLADFSSISDGLGPIAAIGGADRGSMPIVDSPTTEGWIDPTLYEGGLDNSDLMGDIDNWDLMNPIGGDTPNEVSFENQNTEENNFGLDNSELIGDIDNFDLQ
jgi:hypothetical protein